MKIQTVTIWLTVVVFLASVGVSWSADKLILMPDPNPTQKEFTLVELGFIEGKYKSRAGADLRVGPKQST